MVAARRVVVSGLSRACTALVELTHWNRVPWSVTRLHLGSEARSPLPVQPRLMSVASRGLAVRPVGAAGGGGAPPSSTPERTALGPATLVTVMVTEPPVTTLIGTLTQAPWAKSVLMLALRTPEPSLTLM